MAITLLSRNPLPGTVGAVMRPTEVSSKPNKERSKSLWEVQGVLPNGSIVTTLVAYGTLKQTEMHRLGQSAQVLLAFIRGENHRLESWLHFFPQPDKSWAEIAGTSLRITKPKKLIEDYSEEGGCRRITEDEATQLVNELKKQDITLKLAAEKLARLDWARRFPDIRDRPIPTGQTSFFEGKYKPKKIGK